MALQKFEYLRSVKHLNIIRSLECCVCGMPPRSQAAHSNSSEYGKGRGIKASDECTIPLCWQCHRNLDLGVMEDSVLNGRTHKEFFKEKLYDVALLLKARMELLPDAERLLKERGVLE